MPVRMNRGKGQIMYNYLPGYTFDFDKTAVIAQVTSIRGALNTELNLRLILAAIKRQTYAWGDLASVFSDPQLELHSERFVLLEPQKVAAHLFPKVFWCQNRNCGRVHDYSRSGEIPRQAICPVCKKGKLSQFRWIKIHQCGEILPLTPPYECSKCKTKNQFALDTQGSERISLFVWICRKCNNRSPLFGGYCPSCDWEALSGDKDTRKKQMSIEVFRAKRVFHPQYAVLLNQPGPEVSRLVSINDWQTIVAGFFMTLPGLSDKDITSFTAAFQKSTNPIPSLSESEIESLKSSGKTEVEIQTFLSMQAELSSLRKVDKLVQDPDSIGTALVTNTGVAIENWVSAGSELLEFVLLHQSNQTMTLSSQIELNLGQSKALEMLPIFGINKISLASDFPMTHVSFGFSRGEYAPRQCRLQNFPLDRENQGRFPIFVDTIQADAIVVQLNAKRMLKWLRLNNIAFTLPPGKDPEKSETAHFVELFSELATQSEPVTLTQTLTQGNREARMTFGLLHTMSHLFLRKAALLCGLDQTSLSEYILPRALTFAIYSNHRFGATIGALSSLFEESLPEWLGQILNETRRCIYDPVCEIEGGNCHACTHLSETSCRFFNLNLGRSFLFGGNDPEIGFIEYGYWDNRVNDLYPTV